MALQEKSEVWPIIGGDLRKSVGDFLKGRLKLDSSFMVTMGDLSVKRVPFTERSKVKNEAIVVFASVEVRDIVRRSAKELAGHPDAGIRLEIPYCLQSNLKALESVSFALKKKYPAIKRNVKFDDEHQDLVLDFCIDPEGSGVWRKVRPAQAAELKGKFGRSTTEEVSFDDLGRLLEDP